MFLACNTNTGGSASAVERGAFASTVRTSFSSLIIMYQINNCGNKQNFHQSTGGPQIRIRTYVNKCVYRSQTQTY